MVKRVMLSDAVYANCDHVCVESKFDKNAGGYVINCMPIQREPFGYSIVIDANYYALRRKMSSLICPASRRNAKKAEVADRAIQNAEKWVREFLDRIGRKDILVIGEV